MLEFLAVNQFAFPGQGLTDRIIGLVNMNAGKLARRTGIGAIRLHHVQRADAVGTPYHEIFHTMIGCSMDCASTGIG